MNKSTDSINTKFVPSAWTGTFNANNNIFAAPPPTRKPSSPVRKGSRILRQQASNAQLPQATPSERLFSQYAEPAAESVPPGPSSPPQDPVKFDASEWAKTIKDPSWAFQPEALRSDPAIVGTSRPSSKNARKSSSKGMKIPTTVPRPATATAVDDEGEPVSTTPTPAATTTQTRSQTADVDDLMDIDMEGVSPGNVMPSPDSTPAATVASAKQKEPRFVQVEPSSLRQETPSREHVGPKLDDLATTLPGSTTGDGLGNLKDISSTLPFESKPSTTLPTKSYTPQILTLPKLPVAPEQPTKLTNATWRDYCEKFARYLAKYHEFDGAMLDHFLGRRTKAAELVNRGAAELESVGAEKWLEYNRAVEEDERVRTHWDIAGDKHRQAVKSFESVRERVRTRSGGAGLADV